ncbi:MAG TPA: glycosyltransferase [Thermotogota bacterium]|nr:glycosyltransferase [Thermotogota bacterium]
MLKDCTISDGTENKPIIIVNDVAASQGGALSILRQSLSELSENKEAEHFHWIVFVSNDLMKDYNAEHIEIRKVNVKKWHKRIWWDTIGIKKYLNNSKIKPALAVSLMSVGFKYLKVPQMVYIHQSLPYGDFSEFKRFEWKSKFYTRAIGIWMKWSISKNSIIIVQTEWMKEAVNKKLGIPIEQIQVIVPNVEKLYTTTNSIKKAAFSNRLFYPAVPTVSYKNHELLVRILFDLKERTPKLFYRLKIVFTCKPEDSKLTRFFAELAKKWKVDSQIDWVGYISVEQMKDEYENADIVLFPSKLETYGLPLIESASMGKQILVLDKPYAHDALNHYEGVSYLSDSAIVWSRRIEEFYSKSNPPIKPLVSGENHGWSQFVKIVKAMTNQ